jgi:hypothetical protein
MNQAEQPAAGDALQRSLRSRFQARLSRSVQPTAGGGRGANGIEGGRACSMWDGGILLSGRLNRVRVWPRVPAACGSRTRGSNRRASGPPLSRGLR